MITKTKERPILFNGEMVRAILDGRKTQTRRVIKPQPETERDILPTTDEVKHVIVIRESRHVKRCLGARNYADEFCPYGVPGDQLWVRETWQHEDGSCNDHRCGQPTHIWFKAAEKNPDMFASWRPSIHMPRWASRIDLLIKKVRVERVQDITIDDAIAEGVWLDPPDAHGFRSEVRLAFQELWNSINAKRGFGWEVNPWVWVVEFERVQP